MPFDVWTLMLTNNLSFRNKSLRARIKIVHIDMRMQDIEKIFCSSEKKSKAKEQFCKSIPIVLRDLHSSKFRRPRNRPYDAWLGKPEKRNKIRMSKQLRFVASTAKFNGNQTSFLILI